MNYLLVSTVRMFLTEALAAALIADFLLKYLKKEAQPRLKKALTAALITVTSLSLLAMANLGYYRSFDPKATFWQHTINYHEQAHFYFSSKYFTELGYENIYKAIYLADMENGGDLRNVSTVRDLKNFNLISPWDVYYDSAQVKAKFTTERWLAFRNDVYTFLANGTISLPMFFTDHGNTGSPLWAMFANMFTGFTSPTNATMFTLTFLDLALLVLMFYQIIITFGKRVGLYSLAIFALLPLMFDYINGDLLRFDWLFASVIAVCLFYRKKYSWSGVFCAYAILSKLFPIMLVVPLGIKLIREIYQTRKWRNKYTRFFIALMGSAIIFVGVTSLYFHSYRIWPDYEKRISVTFSEKFYMNNYSYKQLFLQIADQGPANFWKYQFVPPEFSMGKANVSVTNYKIPYYGSLLLILALYAVVIWRTTDLKAMALGVPLIFFFLVINSNYYSFLLIFAFPWLLDSHKKKGSLTIILGLLAMIIAAQYFQSFNKMLWTGYLVSILLLGLFLLTPLLELKARPE